MEISALAQNRDWLDKATRSVVRHWKNRNSTSKTRAGGAGWWLVV